MPPKDREIHIHLENGVRIAYLRSSARPVEYALLLQRYESKGWKTMIVADNSHEGERRRGDAGEHHFHRYVEGEKQRAEPLPFEVVSTNDAMAKVMRWFEDEWKELIS